MPIYPASHDHPTVETGIRLAKRGHQSEIVPHCQQTRRQRAVRLATGSVRTDASGPKANACEKG
ncbi:hypothetical protein CGZ80_03995 [Rhodopirellula sp. MGV]|nr:hypothetical protein CGZ80_03995 [Rhodopirellula sp. MGV]PNY37074.1 hypothetical protein C2E31_09505 [Rhodopirellula baltica]